LQDDASSAGRVTTAQGFVDNAIMLLIPGHGGGLTNLLFWAACGRAAIAVVHAYH